MFRVIGWIAAIVFGWQTGNAIAIAAKNGAAGFTVGLVAVVVLWIIFGVIGAFLDLVVSAIFSGPSRPASWYSQPWTGTSMTFGERMRALFSKKKCYTPPSSDKEDFASWIRGTDRH